MPLPRGSFSNRTHSTFAHNSACIWSASHQIKRGKKIPLLLTQHEKHIKTCPDTWERRIRANSISRFSIPQCIFIHFFYGSAESASGTTLCSFWTHLSHWILFQIVLTLFFMHFFPPLHYDQYSSFYLLNIFSITKYKRAKPRNCALLNLSYEERTDEKNMTTDWKEHGLFHKHDRQRVNEQI